jgi:predicted metalloendopeptidase
MAVPCGLRVANVEWPARENAYRTLDAWYDAFSVHPPQKLYLAPPDRVHVW